LSNNAAARLRFGWRSISSDRSCAGYVNGSKTRRKARAEAAPGEHQKLAFLELHGFL
jgi:hypothetical protein